ncbi:hypothetical protein B0J11DRAFT_529798 [Dendryphion nanum]|uniref:Uncharacterized protein n=1 Tax=Dendryphion nanum TaxID=256645 RepID=A0A9P9DN69_9PLEO|nr:hypothetical protein B0J11DRAFT_529798 [Dendryphion nanum]
MELPTVTVDDLKRFHAKHFPLAPLPEQFCSEVQQGKNDQQCEDDGLGYYEDGSKRTLTDEQIAMFRHTEIRNIIRERRRKQEVQEFTENEMQYATRISAEGTLKIVNDNIEKILSPKSDDATRITSPLKKVQDGRIEKSKNNQWVKQSNKSKNKQKRKNSKYKKNLQQRRKRENTRSGEDGVSDNGDDDEHSDEWNPWRQATGPDVQKDTTVDLDY